MQPDCWDSPAWWHLRPAPMAGLMGAGEGTARGATPAAWELVSTSRNCWVVSIHGCISRPSWAIRRCSLVTSSTSEGYTRWAMRAVLALEEQYEVHSSDFIAKQYLLRTYNPRQVLHLENATMTSCLSALLRHSSIPLLSGH